MCTPEKGFNMKKLGTVFLISILLIPATLHAGRQEGILRQFRAVEEALRSRKKSAEARKETLENNLERGLREAILRMFYNEKEKWLTDLNPNNFHYENPTSPKVYYVKYKNLLVRFDFATDPEKYYQAPILRKVLIVDEASAHAAEEAAKGTPSSEAGSQGK